MTPKSVREAVGAIVEKMRDVTVANGWSDREAEIVKHYADNLATALSAPIAGGGDGEGLDGANRAGSVTDDGRQDGARGADGMPLDALLDEVKDELKRHAQSADCNGRELVDMGHGAEDNAPRYFDFADDLREAIPEIVGALRLRLGDKS
jgi:hypothetical protein